MTLLPLTMDLFFGVLAIVPWKIKTDSLPSFEPKALLRRNTSLLRPPLKVICISTPTCSNKEQACKHSARLRDWLCLSLLGIAETSPCNKALVLRSLSAD